MALIGIDLGTTFCAVATLDDRGRPATIPNRDGEMLTPSAVYLGPDGSAVVGQPALDIGLEQPDRVATFIKRRMGLPDFGRPVAGRIFRPETLAALILKKLAADAAIQVGTVDSCVITVPAYFDDTRRKATMDAGRIAGLEVLDILDEPSAAALAYLAGGAAESPGQTVLVYDLGGGTFDVTLVKFSRKKFQVLAIEGDVRLGGKDWDDRIVEYVSRQFLEKFGSDPRTDAQSLAMLLSAAERTKRTLSKLENGSLTCTHDGQRLSLPLTRAEFEALTRDLVTRTRLTTLQALSQSRLTWKDVDRVLMVGGSTHMPIVGRMLKELTGREPERSLAVSEVVARGAAAHAGIVRQRSPMPPPLMDFLDGIVEITVNAHSLGVEVRRGEDRLNDRLIAKNTQLPAMAERTYFTAKASQERVRVRILQGEASQAEACMPVGECWIEGLPGQLPKGSPVEVSCGVAENGRIVVTARDTTTGRAVRAEIHRPGGLTEEQIAAETAWVRRVSVS